MRMRQRAEIQFASRDYRPSVPVPRPQLLLAEANTKAHTISNRSGNRNNQQDYKSLE